MTISESNKSRIKELKKAYSLKEISKIFGINIHTVEYILYRNREKNKEYMKNYMLKRYNSDNEFRKKIIFMNVRRQKELRIEGKTWNQLHSEKVRKYQKQYRKNAKKIKRI